MPDFETLLVPLDGSPTAEASLTHARWLARGLDAQLVLFESALARTLPGLPNATPTETISSAERYLEPLEASIRADGIRCRSVVAYGPAAESILDNAELQRADLVVISARGQQDSVHWAQGDVAGKVVCGLRAPTLVVQEPHRSASCILAPLDGSRQAESALAPVGELAGRMRLQVVLLAVSPVGADRARAAEYLRRAAERLRQRGVSTATEVRVGDPAREIVEMARATGSSMIALSTSSRSDPEDRSFGTIADRVLHEARQPVLLLRPPAVEQTIRRSVRARCCHNCGREIYRRELAPDDRCPRCGFVLRSCANCVNYDGIICQMGNPWSRGFIGTSCGDFRFRRTLVAAKPAELPRLGRISEASEARV